MKRIATLLLAFLYLATAVGFTLTRHACMGSPSSWESTGNKGISCSMCGMKKAEAGRSGCCRDQHQLLRNTSDQSGPVWGFAQVRVPVIDLPDFLQLADGMAAVSLPPTEHASGPSWPPGDLLSPDRYLRNRVFRI